MTLKCLSDGVPTPTLSWYKPEGSEIDIISFKSMRSVYFDKKKFYIRSAFSFAFLLIITVSVVLEVKPKCSYKVLDRVTYSLCTSHSIV